MLRQDGRVPPAGGHHGTLRAQSGPSRDLRAFLAGILETGDVIGREGGRMALAVTDELATVGADEREEELAA
jgi:hypothetical protein